MRTGMTSRPGNLVRQSDWMSDLQTFVSVPMNSQVFADATSLIPF